MTEKTEPTKEQLEEIAARANNPNRLSSTLSGLIVQQVDLYVSLRSVIKAIEKLNQHGIVTKELTEASEKLEESYNSLREVGDRFFEYSDER